ncbi:MAG: HNH endonuclease, partial [Deltaproteobacteria bacterium]|nr:HNH endonuclease [Deltaproteobacteria bacterium]
CAITGLAVPELLRASHLKPWRDCAMDAERLDVFNGLLLAPHLDAALDGGLVTLSDAGSLIVSSRLDSEARRLLGLDVPRRLRFVEPRHHPYLAWHREHEFERRLRPDAGWRG